MKKSTTGKKQKKGKSVSKRDLLEKQLKTLLKDVDKEGLVYLIRQTQVLLHNLQVDKVNQELQKIDRKKSQTTKTQKSVIGIEEAGDRSHFVIIIDNIRKMLSLDEMRSITNICHSAPSKTEAAARLYNWLNRNRRDILADTSIGRPGNPLLGLLFQFVKSKYKVKK
jgi:hypothetical protein